MSIAHLGPRAAVTALSLALLGSAHAAAQLPVLNIDTRQTTVSGLASGGFMANQLGYTFPSTFSGVGVFASGPSMCAGRPGDAACMYGTTISVGMLTTLQADLNNWSGTPVAHTARVAHQKIYLFVGNGEGKAGARPGGAGATPSTYADTAGPAANLEHVWRNGTGFVFPTDFDGAGNSSCGSSAPPHISNCGYDGAKAALSRFYGRLAARNDAPAKANYIEFDQSVFTRNAGMAATGWVYVPASCASGAVCRLHVALHGCQQNVAAVGDAFIRNTGYTRWADTNDIVVLFPQTGTDSARPAPSAGGRQAGTAGCWDWLGGYAGNSTQRAGSQQLAIKAMVDHLSSGLGSTGGGARIAAEDTPESPVSPEVSGAVSSDATSTGLTPALGAQAGAIRQTAQAASPAHADQR